MLGKISEKTKIREKIHQLSGPIVEFEGIYVQTGHPTLGTKLT